MLASSPARSPEYDTHYYRKDIQKVLGLPDKD